MSTHSSGVPLGEKFSQYPNTRSFRLLERIGGSYLGLAIFAVEVIGFPIAALSLLIVLMNAQFTADQFTVTALWASILIPLGDILLLVTMYFLTRDARQRLD